MIKRSINQGHKEDTNGKIENNFVENKETVISLYQNTLRCNLGEKMDIENKSKSSESIIEKLGFVTIVVKDQEAALKFYTGKLGFEKRRDYSFPNFPRFLSVAPNGQKYPEIVLMKEGASKVQPKEAHTGMVFWTKDCNMAYQKLKAAGVTFVSGPLNMPFGIQADFIDPDGNRFSLTQPKA